MIRLMVQNFIRIPVGCMVSCEGRMRMNDIDKPIEGSNDGPFPEDDEEIIDLTDVVNAPVEREEDEGSASMMGEEADGDGDPADDMMANILMLEKSMEEGLDEEEDDGDDFIQDLGLDLEVDLDDVEALGDEPEADPDEGADIDVSSEQLEAALERVIEKVYAEKIEQLLVTTVEKTIKAEIKKLNILIEDASNEVDF